VSTSAEHANTGKTLASLAASQVTSLARVASGINYLEVKSWDSEPLHGGFGSAVDFLYEKARVRAVELARRPRKSVALAHAVFPAKLGPVKRAE
jgi:hypothetical protein